MDLLSRLVGSEAEVSQWPPVELEVKEFLWPHMHSKT